MIEKLVFPSTVRRRRPRNVTLHFKEARAKALLLERSNSIHRRVCLCFRRRRPTSRTAVSDTLRLRYLIITQRRLDRSGKEIFCLKVVNSHHLRWFHSHLVRI